MYCDAFSSVELFCLITVEIRFVCLVSGIIADESTCYEVDFCSRTLSEIFVCKPNAREFAMYICGIVVTFAKIVFLHFTSFSFNCKN